MSVQTVTLAGRRYVILPESEYSRLVGKPKEPKLPIRDKAGNYPAVASMRVLLARDIIRGRRAVGLTQAELAKRAGIRPETLSRIEHGKHSPSVATVERIHRVLDAQERDDQR